MSDPDIVARLRGWSQGYQMDEAVRDMRDAADEIERLREALRIEQEELAACCIDRKETQRERDEARRWWCRLIAYQRNDRGEGFDPKAVAVEEGWDCFKENTDDQ